MSVPLKKLIDSKKPYAEDTRVMMADVLFHAEDARASVLAITARRPKSGISSVASELAALLAQSKRRVLLIDANLHEPVQHKRLGVANDAGLARMLEELRNMKVSLNAAVNQEPIEMQQQEAISMMETRRVAGVHPGQAPIVKLHQQRYSSNSNGASDKVIDI
jgi:Mrp family chromosome partitioning ATPase